MKKAIIICITILSANCFAQTKPVVKSAAAAETKSEPITGNNYNIFYYKDTMTDRESVYSKEVIYCSEDGKKGFIITLGWDFKDSKIVYNGIRVRSFGIGNCVENDDLIIFFDDNTKVSLKSWNKFNCDGNSYFDLNCTELNNLAKRIKAIKFQNGKDYSSLMFELKTEKDKTFFMEAKNASDKQIYKTVDKMN